MLRSAGDSVHAAPSVSLEDSKWKQHQADKQAVQSPLRTISQKRVRRMSATPELHSQPSVFTGLQCSF